ncbi:MAG: hypothetical protein AABZ31_12940 [Bdellovibrionota bacterium]
MKKLAVLFITLVSVSSFAQSHFGGRDRNRGVRCVIHTSDYTRYDGFGRSCGQAQDDVIQECIYGQRSRGVRNWDRCEHSIRPGKKYKMSCTDRCGYPPYLR